MIRQEVKKLTEKAIKNLYKQKIEVKIGKPDNVDFGDYSTNAAMLLMKNPEEIAGRIKSSFFQKVEVKNGFINFFLSEDYLQKQVEEILKQGEKFGSLKNGKGEKVNVEFISANPTGPLTLGNGRGGFCGDVLSNVLKKAGYRVCREYYINDRGEQVIKLGHSVLGDAEAVYQGKYIENLRKKIKGNDPGKVGEKAADMILNEMIKPAIKKMGIKFDVWFSEKSLYKKDAINKVLKFLRSKNLADITDGAVWFKSKQFGDDKDRVLVKASGEETYFLSDIAYLKNKFGRGFERLVFFWGADHAGYVSRIKGVIEALGHSKEKADFIIMQLVKLFQDGKEVRMSKRTGLYVTIDELIDEVGVDAARFFFLTRSPDTHFNFDLNSAKEQSEKNPVYYAQYAYARICSILRKSEIRSTKSENLRLLKHESELGLIKQLLRFPEIVEDTARDYQVQRLPQYAMELATAFNHFYRDCKVIADDKNLQEARLGLVLATKIVLKNTLDLMGISAPEKM